MPSECQDDERACADALAALEPLVDGELGPADAEEIARHLDACGRCGLEESLVRELKRAVCASGNGVDAHLLARLRRFARDLGSLTRP